MASALRTADEEVLIFPSEDQMENYLQDLMARDVDLAGYTTTADSGGAPNYKFVGGRLLHIANK